MKPDFAVLEDRVVDNKRIITVDTSKAHYKRQPWRTLGDAGKRAFENLIFFSCPGRELKVIYT